MLLPDTIPSDTTWAARSDQFNFPLLRLNAANATVFHLIVRKQFASRWNHGRWLRKVKILNCKYQFFLEKFRVSLRTKNHVERKISTRKFESFLRGETFVRVEISGEMKIEYIGRSKCVRHSFSWWIRNANETKNETVLFEDLILMFDLSGRLWKYLKEYFRFSFFLSKYVDFYLIKKVILILR